MKASDYRFPRFGFREGLLMVVHGPERDANTLSVEYLQETDGGEILAFTEHTCELEEEVVLLSPHLDLAEACEVIGQKPFRRLAAKGAEEASDD